MSLPKAVFVFSHATLLNAWDQAREQLRGQGIELVVASQMAPADWESFIEKDLATADAVFMNATRYFPTFGPLVESAKQAKLLVPGGMETCSAVPDADPELTREVEAYLKAGRPADLANSARFMLHRAGVLDQPPPPPTKPTLCAIFDPEAGDVFTALDAYLTWRAGHEADDGKKPIAAVCFDRTWWLEGATELPEACMRRLREKGFLPLGVFCDWELATQIDGPDHPLLSILGQCGERLSAIWNILLSHTSAGLADGGPFARFGVPVFQVIRNYSQTVEEWQGAAEGLSPLSISYSIIQPEMLGCIEPTVLACNESVDGGGMTGPRNRAVIVPERIDHLASRTAAWHRLQAKPNAEKRVAVLLHNSPCKGVEGTVGYAAGLDAVESTVRLMRRLADQGYTVQDIPENGKALLDLLLEKKAISEFRWTNVEEIVDKGGVLARIDAETYGHDFSRLSPAVRERVNDAWEPFPGKAMVHENAEGQPDLLVTGLRFGNVLVMVEPKRGCWGPKCDGEVCRILHDPDIPPPHHWLASFWYLQREADVLVPMGSESPLEYLPGKAVGLSADCYPEISLGDLPCVYPYIADSTAEGLIAKRRGRAVLIGHLPEAKARLHDEDTALDRMADLHAQYAHAGSVSDSGRRARIASELKKLMTDAGMLAPDADDGLFEARVNELPRRLQRLRSRVVCCGLHLLGQPPEEEIAARYVEELREGIDGEVDEPAFQAALARTTDEMDNLVAALSGRHVPAGPSGSFSRGKADVAPTGRNIYGIDLRSLPTPAAYDMGRRIGEMLLNRYLREEGRFPKSIGITLWSSDAFRADGELTSQALWLMGCRPQWGSGGRVNGIDVIPADELVMKGPDGRERPRPRVDVVIQMSGVVRDVLPSFYTLLDLAASTVGGLDEPAEVNFVRANVEARMKALQEEMKDADGGALRRLAGLRVFSSKPGSYGTGVSLALDASAWNDDKDLAEAFVNWTGYAYGSGLSGGVPADVGLKATLAHYAHLMGDIDIAYQRAIGAEYDALAVSCYVGFQGGMAAATRGISGKNVKLYWGDSVTGEEPEVRDLAEEIELSLQSSLLNPAWLANRKTQGYQGAANVAGGVNTLFGWSATTHQVTKEQFDAIHQTYVENEENRRWLAGENVYALEEIVRRLLEAVSRKLWDADEDRIASLQSAVLELEGDIEERMGDVKGEFQGGSVDIKTRQDVAEWKYDYAIK